MKRLVISVILAVALLLAPVSGVLAATSEDVVVTATPAFISISIDISDWIINGISGNSVINPNTTYYSNPLGDTTSPSSTVVDGECRFSINNTSTVATNIVVNFPNHSGGDASTNSDTGSAGATSFGAYSYYSGMLYSNKVIAKATSSDDLISSLAAGLDFKWGLEYTSQTNAWTTGTNMTSTVTITVTAS